jgi:type IV pilus secretin PilQ/predicted competence protein
MMKYRYRSMAALAFILLISGCATLKKAEVPSVPPVATKEEKATVQKQALEELVLPQVEEKMKEEERLYSLSVRDADVQEILLAFAKDANLNFTVDPDVTGKVTVDLKNVTLERALDTILSSIGLEYRKEGNLIHVLKPKPETRIFSLNYLTSVRTGTALVSGAIGGRGAGASTTQGQASGGSGTQGGSSGGYSNVESKGTSDLWGDIEKGIKGMLSPEGQILISKASNSIVITDYPKHLNKVAEFLETVSGSVQRQVMIQAKIIEVTLSKDYQAGVDWKYIQSLPRMSNLSWGLAQGTTGFPGLGGTTGTTGDTGGTGSGGTTGGTVDIPGVFKIMPFGGTFRIGAADTDVLLSDIVEAISEQGTVNILSSPRISTLNNQPAIIKAAREDVFFQTSRDITVNATTTSSNAQYITIGIILSVTPQISADGTITMNIHPTITEKVGEKTSTSGDTAPVIDVRETDTVAQCRDRETIVIAGLMQDKVFTIDTSLPVMKDLPYFGKFFRHTTQEKRKTELVIMLTPTLITGSRIAEMSTADSERLEKLRQALPPSAQPLTEER